jgi:hypothetical protein
MEGKGGGESTMGIRNFNLRRSQVTRMGRNGLNQSFIYTHPFLPTLTTIFFAPLQLSSPKILKGHLPPLAPQVSYMKPYYGFIYSVFSVLERRNYSKFFKHKCTYFYGI